MVMAVNPATVFVVDDDKGINQALERLLDSVNIPCELFTSAEDFLDRYNGDDGCLILDVRLRGMSGILLQERLARRKVKIPVIFLTGHGNIQMAVKAMKGGAFDFLTKPFHNQDLLDKVHQALISNYDESVIEKERKILRQKLTELTPREKELLDAIVEGLQTKEIAAMMGISINTAQIHRANLMKKMKAKNLGSLINMVIKYQ
jgi:two-component system, LuxR family, response regulator FixJ